VLQGKANNTHTTLQQAALFYSVETKKNLSTLKMLGKISSEFFDLLISFTHSIKALGMNTH
jgi:hypothetical protein